ncbi:hypothetical protein E2C01_014176 [Portunus trituberculatus]|uniref:Uncharacterized protein n=1 Tax=Portunus trituberculatus TaxID=210409 RepID=A0A5B7DJF1_PORTR|nr:hypothetical protein [Portunus trituberculatus]
MQDMSGRERRASTWPSCDSRVRAALSTWQSECPGSAAPCAAAGQSGAGRGRARAPRARCRGAWRAGRRAQPVRRAERHLTAAHRQRPPAHAGAAAATPHASTVRGVGEAAAPPGGGRGWRGLAGGAWCQRAPCRGLRARWGPHSLTCRGEGGDLRPGAPPGEGESRCKGGGGGGGEGGGGRPQVP